MEVSISPSNRMVPQNPGTSSPNPADTAGPQNAPAQDLAAPPDGTPVPRSKLLPPDSAVPAGIALQIASNSALARFAQGIPGAKGQGGETMPGEIDHAQQNATLEKLRASSIPAVQQQAAKLAEVYHDREMAHLAQDAYIAADVNLTSGGKLNTVNGQAVSPAAKDRAPPAGWSRLSEQPEKMAEFAQRMGMSGEQLQDLLRPEKSGFRAEIYLPDEKVLGAGYQPTLVFKGSSGTVSTADGKSHDTTNEDFLANNFPQAIGLQTDYYDRAMKLGSLMQKSGMDFEVAGHSLGGGMATAAAAVSGARATVFNPANLNPQTVTDFANEHAGVKVHDISQSTTNYEIKGELLNDGVQRNMNQHMDGYERAMLGAFIKDGSQLLRDLPEGRALLENNLKASLPETAQKTVDAFLDKLATANTAQLMRDIPASVGQVRMLDPYQVNDQNRIEPRADTQSLQGVTGQAQPVVRVAANAMQGAVAGKQAGEGVAAAGQLVHQGLQAGDQAAQAVGQALGHGARLARENEGLQQAASIQLFTNLRAWTRQATGELSALASQAQGAVEHLGNHAGASVLDGLAHVLPASQSQSLHAQAQNLRQNADASALEHTQQAQKTRGETVSDVRDIRERGEKMAQGIQQAMSEIGQSQQQLLTAAGQRTGAMLNNAGQAVENTTSHALTAGAVVGGAVAGGATALENLGQTLYSAVRLAQSAPASGQEALQRHLMSATVLPSMEHAIREQEAQALQMLDAPQRAEADRIRRLQTYMTHNK